MKTYQLILFGLTVHVIFFYSIFDIYFSSPLVHGMALHASPVPAPARRLVLFVADGLRADKFFELDEQGNSRAPYLRNIIETSGAWGVSHTRVPTESRPGHVALIAGFYEDVSAVAKGWKENPVEFDSVFNESRTTWSWGSPDILPMFAKGEPSEHVFTDCYPSTLEDFAGSDQSKLDTWVFDKVKDFFVAAKSNATVSKMLNQDKIVLFLHLLGIDTNGHAHKPYSNEYLDNIRTVDSGIKEIVSLLDDFYNDDGKTAFIMTSDHGMTNWGSHGAGHPSETLTPLMGWGAGVRGPKIQQDMNQYSDNFSKDWKLSHLKRTDVEQADVAPLLSTLIGVPFPKNSVGSLPIDYLNGGSWEKAEQLFTNAKQVLAQYQVKMSQVKDRSLSFTFRPFTELSSVVQIDMSRNIAKLLQGGQYLDAIQESKEIIALALKGLAYYQTYDRVFLGSCVALGFLGWIGYTLAMILQDHSGLVQTQNKMDSLSKPTWRSDASIKIGFSVLTIVICGILLVQSAPVMYYVYCLTPVLLWMLTALRCDAFLDIVNYILQTKQLLYLTATLLFSIGGLEVLVLGFFYRELISVGLICMAVWIISTPLWKTNKSTAVFWLISCLMVAVFPLLPVVGRDLDYNIVLLAGVLSVLLGTICMNRVTPVIKPGRRKKATINVYYLNVLQVLLLVLSLVIIHRTAASVTSKQNVAAWSQNLSWVILVCSCLLPMMTRTDIYTRLLSICLSFLAPYFLMSISYESFFCLGLCFLLYYWLQVEYLLSENNRKLEAMDFCRDEIIGASSRPVVLADVRRAYFFVFLILTAFFGTGNIASINSFDPASVLSFLSVFNPFIMGGLMLTKIIIPFILVTCVFSAIHITTRVPTRALFLIVLVMSDVMALNFFFLVKDYGSWLDIGTSISHYIIVMTMIIFINLLLGISHILTRFSFHDIFDKKQL